METGVAAAGNKRSIIFAIQDEKIYEKAQTNTGHTNCVPLFSIISTQAQPEESKPNRSDPPLPLQLDNAVSPVV